MRQLIPAAALCCLFSLSLHAAAPEPALCYRGIDPVALLDGKEVAGDEQFTQAYRNWEFRFISAASRDSFNADPEKFAPQYDGACMKMGPLSGGGSPGRFAVHEGRIYLFASDSCLAKFKAEPDRYADKPDAPLAAPDPAAAEPVLTKAFERMGGERLAQAKSIRQVVEIEARSGERVSRVVRTTTLTPDSYSSLDEYEGNYKYGWTVDAEGGQFTDTSARVGRSVADYMFRDRLRSPAGLLLEWKSGRASCSKPVTETIQGQALQRIDVHERQATTTAWIDTDGRIVRVGYRGRAGERISDIVRIFDDFRSVNGIELPHAFSVVVDGQPLTTQTATVKSIDIE